MAHTVKFEIVRSDISGLKNLFERAANVATLIGREKVISISHSSDGDGLVTVWYWSDEDTNILGLKEAE